eukprot:scaffold6395_cov59-Isochrysis_galbana.AAC.1
MEGHQSGGERRRAGFGVGPGGLWRRERRHGAWHLPVCTSVPSRMKPRRGAAQPSPMTFGGGERVGQCVWWQRVECTSRLAALELQPETNASRHGGTRLPREPPRLT